MKIALILLSFGIFSCFPINNFSKEKPKKNFQEIRMKMVEEQIKSRGVSDPLVLKAMEKVKRHQFVETELQEAAYEDHPLPIGEGQTISQPYIVASMTELLQLKGGEKILEVGTGSGYQAAVLAEIVREVYTIEIIPELALKAKKNLEANKYKKVYVKTGDGYLGWPEMAPFDGILVTAAPDHIPKPLVEQLNPGARMVIPVGPTYQVQYLKVIEKNKNGSIKEDIQYPVRFVPLTREKNNN